MKEGFIHVCFIIDESGSMIGSESDVCGGFNKVIKEQKELVNGSCAISLYRFESKVKKDFIGKPVSEIGKMCHTSGSFSKLLRTLNNITTGSFANDKSNNELEDGDLSYEPFGGTAMNDGIGQAIDEIGKWLSDMPEEERPEKNLIVIMTDGEENSSTVYTIDRVKEMIKHQAEVYNWSFVYMGTDISDSTYANKLMKDVPNCSMAYGDRGDVGANYDIINSVSGKWRNMTGASYEAKVELMTKSLNDETSQITTSYEKKIGKTIK